MKHERRFAYSSAREASPRAVERWPGPDFGSLESAELCRRVQVVPLDHNALALTTPETSSFAHLTLGPSRATADPFPSPRRSPLFHPVMQMKDFMNLYTNLVERCFNTCCNDFTSKALSSKEVSGRLQDLGAF